MPTSGVCPEGAKILHLRQYINASYYCTQYPQTGRSEGISTFVGLCKTEESFHYSRESCHSWRSSKTVPAIKGSVCGWVAGGTKGNTTLSSKPACFYFYQNAISHEIAYSLSEAWAFTAQLLGARTNTGGTAETWHAALRPGPRPAVQHTAQWEELLGASWEELLGASFSPNPFPGVWPPESHHMPHLSPHRCWFPWQHVVNAALSPVEMTNHSP